MENRKIKLTPIEEEYESGIELDLTGVFCIIGAICAALAAFALVWKLIVRK